METSIQKLLITLSLVAVATYSIFATYQWVAADSRNKLLIGYISSEADRFLRIIGDMGSDIAYLIDTNASETILRTRLYTYFHVLYSLSTNMRILHVSTNEERFWLMEASMENLQAFLLSAINRREPRSILINNIEILEQISSIIRDLKTVENITEEEAEKILALTNNLEF